MSAQTFTTAHEAFVTAMAPSADLFATGTSLGAKFQTFCIAIAACAIAWFLLKQLFRAHTFTAGIIAIASAFVLFFLLNNINNASLRKPLDDTVKTVTNGMQQIHPAGDRATAFLQGGSLS